MMMDHNLRARCQAFKSCLYDIASGLNESDIHSLCFLYKDTISRQCICTSPDVENIHVLCPYHRSFSGVVLIDQLFERGVLSQARPDDVVKLLEKIGRVDLAEQFRDSFVLVNSHPIPVPTPTKIGMGSIAEYPERDGVAEYELHQQLDDATLTTGQFTVSPASASAPRMIARQASFDEPSLDTCTSCSPIPLSQIPIPTDQLSRDSSAVRETDVDNLEEHALYKVVLNKNELEEVKHMVRHSSSDSRSKLVEKLESATEANTQNGSQSPLSPEQQIPLRALSLDCFRRRLRYEGSLPDVTQSFDSFQKYPLKPKRMTWCDCGGACLHSPESPDSDSCTSSVESVYSNEDLTQSCKFFRKGKPNGVELVEWTLSRKERFLNCIFDHKNTIHCKKVRISLGRGRAKKSVNILLKLFPNGVGKDLGISSTLTMSTIGMSNPNCDLVLFASVRGLDTREDDLISSHKVVFTVKPDSKHTVEGFLPHDVIKQSLTKSFKFMFMFELRVKFKEWVVINDVNCEDY